MDRRHLLRNLTGGIAALTGVLAAQERLGIPPLSRTAPKT